MVCPKCGNQNSSGSRCCDQCGTMLERRPGKGRKLPAIIMLVCIVVVALCVGAIAGPLFHVHTWQAATCRNPMICSKCGETKGGTVEHNWISATCSNPRTCSECGEIDGESLGHIWQAATCISPESCCECGAVLGEAMGHDWTEATYNDPSICINCNETQGTKKIPTQAVFFSDVITKVTASSIYSGDDLGVHAPEKMYDGKLNTNWTENASGNGIGEYVIFYFDDVYAVKELSIFIGSHFDQEKFIQNGRPKEIMLTFSDGSNVIIELSDTYDEQRKILDRYYYTEFIQLTIEDVYAGTRYLDTVIAELNFVVYRP